MILRLPPGEMYGETVTSRRIGGFILSERIYSPRYETPRHSHRWPLLCFVIDGTYTETYGGKTRLCSPSTLLFHPQDELHEEHFHDHGGRSFIVEIEPEWLERIRERVSVAAGAGEFSGGALAGLGRSLYREFASPDDVSPLVVEGLMLEIVAKASRHAAKPAASGVPRWLEQARELLCARFAERLTLDEMAAAVHVHPVHLAQTFHKHYGCTVGEYSRRLRIEFACHKLAITDTPLVDIALAAGFCDQSHFTRTFGRHMGLSPAEFRKSLRSTPNNAANRDNGK